MPLADARAGAGVGVGVYFLLGRVPASLPACLTFVFLASCVCVFFFARFTRYHAGV